MENEIDGTCIKLGKNKEYLYNFFSGNLYEKENWGDLILDVNRESEFILNE
jgi:hypothetical protein